MFLVPLTVFLFKATLILGIALMGRKLLRGRLSAATRYGLLVCVVAGLPLLAVTTVLEILPERAQPPSSLVAPSTIGLSTLALESLPFVQRYGFSVGVPEPLANGLVLGWAVLSLLFAGKVITLRVVSKFNLLRLNNCRDPAWLGALAFAEGKHGLRHPVSLLDGGDRLPFTAGLLGRTIVVPAASEQWPREKREALLLHEVAHVKRGDVPLMTFLELIASALWCVPLIPFALKALAEDREEACDALVVKSGSAPSAYASLLLELASHGSSDFFFGGQGFIGRTKVERRIVEILNAQGRRDAPALKGTAALTLLFSALFVAGPSLSFPIFAVERRPEQQLPGILSIDAKGHVLTRTFPKDALPLVSPLDGEFVVSQPFGRHVNPLTGKQFFHMGLDLANGQSGSSVRSTIAGTVLAANFDRDAGNYVAVGDGIIVVRFLKLRNTRVAVGQKVAVGTELGTVGDTGVSLGPHLHYEVWVRGVAVDPAALLRRGGAHYKGL